MNARDELAKLIADTKYPHLRPAWEEREDRSPVKYFSRKQADALIAAGYVKPRTVTTVEELDALPAGTIIRDPLPCIKWGSGMWGTFSGDSVGSNRIDFPATVLYEPEAQP